MSHNTIYFAWKVNARIWTLKTAGNAASINLNCIIFCGLLRIQKRSIQSEKWFPSSSCRKWGAKLIRWIIWLVTQVCWESQPRHDHNLSRCVFKESERYVVLREGNERTFESVTVNFVRSSHNKWMKSRFIFCLPPLRRIQGLLCISREVSWQVFHFWRLIDQMRGQVDEGGGHIDETLWKVEIQTILKRKVEKWVTGIWKRYKSDLFSYIAWQMPTISIS